MTYKKYLILCFILTALLVLTAGVVNFAVDPLVYFRLPAQGPYLSVERQYKAIRIESFPHNGLLLGTSRMALIDPDDINTGTASFYNASFSSAMPEEILVFLKNNLRNNAQVIIGFDFFVFNESAFPWIEHPLPALTLADKLKYLTSFTTLINSYRHLKKSGRGEFPAILPDGQRDPNYLDPTPPTRPNDLSYAQAFNALRTVHYHNYRFSLQRAAVLPEIRQLVAEKRGRLIVISTPINQKVMAELIKPDPQVYENYQLYIRTLKSAFGPAFHDFSRDPALTDYRCYYRADPHHFLPACGAAMIRRTLE